MNGKTIKKTLAGLGVAALVTGMALATSGCAKQKAKGSCGKGSCSKNAKEGAMSCGKGSCGK